MNSKPNRDVEKVYSVKQFVAKLRRLADALEANKPFVIQVAGERIYVPRDAIISIEHERAEDGEELEFQLKWNIPEQEEPDVVDVEADA
nr:amphi-Trp domain-containing protein [Ardenticatena sp.]